MAPKDSSWQFVYFNTSGSILLIVYLINVTRTFVINEISLVTFLHILIGALT